MIMYPGKYSGILEAERHYVPLAPDHSNMGEVVRILRNPRKAGSIIKNAYEDIACSGQWTYRAFIRHFDRVVDEEMSFAVAVKTNLDGESARISAPESAAEKAVADWKAMSMPRDASPSLRMTSRGVLPLLQTTLQWLRPKFFRGVGRLEQESTNLS